MRLVFLIWLSMWLIEQKPPEETFAWFWGDQISPWLVRKDLMQIDLRARLIL